MPERRYADVLLKPKSKLLIVLSYSFSETLPSVRHIEEVDFVHVFFPVTEQKMI